MKTKKLIPGLIMSLTISSLVFTGCKKDNDNEDFSSDKETMYEQSVADVSFDDASNVSDEGVNRAAAPNTPDSIIIQTNCATITIDTVAVPHTAIIDFGTTACLCRDGNYRSGQIHVSWTGHYMDAGSSHTITFQGYYLNYNKIEGTKTVTNNGLNGSGNLTFSITVNGSITIDPQYSQNGVGGTVTYTSTRTREWIAGASTMQWSDDIYLISGTGSGTSAQGVAFSMSTDPSAPLRKEIGFSHFTSGILNITPANKPARAIDFSYLNGARDNLARVTINGQTFTIILGRRH